MHDGSACGHGRSGRGQNRPTFYLAVEEVEVDGKVILYIHVPESSQVHRCKGKILDRNEVGDFDITNKTNLVSELYMIVHENENSEWDH